MARLNRLRKKSNFSPFKKIKHQNQTSKSSSKSNIKIIIKINTNIKGGGQECPPYTYPISMPPFTLSTCPVM